MRSASVPVNSHICLGSFFFFVLEMKKNETSLKHKANVISVTLLEFSVTFETFSTSLFHLIQKARRKQMQALRKYSRRNVRSITVCKHQNLDKKPVITVMSFRSSLIAPICRALGNPKQVSTAIKTERDVTQYNYTAILAEENVLRNGQFHFIETVGRKLEWSNICNSFLGRNPQED